MQQHRTCSLQAHLRTAPPCSHSRQLHASAQRSGTRAQNCRQVARPRHVTHAALVQPQNDELAPAPLHAAASTPTAISPRHLTALLSNAATSVEVLQLLQQNPPLVNAVHISAALVRAVRLQGLHSCQSRASGQRTAPRSTQQRNAQRRRQQTPQQQEQAGTAQLLQLCTSLLLGGSPSADAAAQVPTAPATHTTARLLESCGVRELSNISWALIKLQAGTDLAPHILQTLQHISSRTAAPAHQQRVQAAPQENTLQFAGSNARSATGWGGHSAQPLSHASQAGTSSRPPSRSGGSTVQRRGQSGLHDAAPQGLVNLLWALAHWYPGVGTAQVAPQHTKQQPDAAPATHQPGGADNQEWSVTPVVPCAATPTQTDTGTPGLRAVHHTTLPPAATTAVRTQCGQLQQVVEALCAALLPQLDTAAPHDIALTVWSLATLRYTPTQCALLPALLSALPTSLSHQSVQGLALLTWGAGRLWGAEQWTAQAHKSLGERVVALAAELAAHPDEASMLAMALRGVRHENPTVWRTLQEQVSHQGLAHWPPSAITAVLTTYASARRPCPHFLAALHTLLLPVAHPPEPADIAQHHATHTDGRDSSPPPLPASAPTAPGSSPLSEAVTVPVPAPATGSSQWSVGDLTRLVVALARVVQSERSKANRASAGVAPAGIGPQQHVGKVSGSLPAATSTVQLCEELIQMAAAGLMEHVAAGRMSSAAVSQLTWALAGSGTPATRIHTAVCARHAVQHFDQYSAAQLVTLLRAHTLVRQGSQRDGDVAASASASAACDSGDVWTQLWSQVAQHSHRLLPELRHTELAAVAVAAAEVGVTDPRLLGGVLQLTLGAVAKRAHWLRQQKLAAAGVQLFTSSAQLQQATGASPAGAEAAPATATSTSSTQPQQAAPVTGLGPLASPTRHMPTQLSAVSVMWALACAGYRNVQLFQLVVTFCCSDNGANRLTPQWLLRLLWACVTAGCYSRALYQELITKLLIQHQRSLSPQQLSQCVQLLAASRHYDAPAMATLCHLLRGRMHTLDGDALACLMWGVAQVNAGVLPQWRAPAVSLQRHASSMSQGACVLTLWAVAVQQHVLFSDWRGIRHRAAVGQGDAAVWTRQSAPAGTVADPEQQAAPAQSPAADTVGCEDELYELQAARPLTGSAAQSSNLQLLQALLDRLPTAHHSPSDDSPLSPQHLPVLAQALALLACSTHPQVRRTVALYLNKCDPAALAVLQSSWLATQTQQGQTVSTSISSPAAANAVSQCLSKSGMWYALSHSAGSATGTTRQQLAQVLQQLGLEVQVTDRLPTGTGTCAGSSHSQASDQASVSLSTVFPLFCPGLLLLPSAQPTPVAVVVAPGEWFARNAPSEVLGPLFTVLTLLGDWHWRSAVLDVRAWQGLRGREQKIRFVRGLLSQWRVVVDDSGSDSDDDEQAV